MQIRSLPIDGNLMKPVTIYTILIS